MNSKIKIIIGVVIVAIFLVVGGIQLMGSKIEYVDFDGAGKITKTAQVQGTWVKEKGKKFEPATTTFEFYMIDHSKKEMKVVYEGAEPNNFEMAESFVVEGNVKDGVFKAKKILTKCPSKYEAAQQNK